MPTIQMPGMPPLSMTDEQLRILRVTMPDVDRFVVSNINQTPFAAPAPAPDPNAGHTLGKRRLPTGTSTTARTPTDPCTAYENAKKAGQSAAILNALATKCKAYQTALADAQAFAAQPAPLDQNQLAAMASQAMDEPQPAEGMSRNLKIGLAVGGGVLLLGIIAYVATR